MKHIYKSVLLSYLAVLRKRCLKVVGQNRVVVRVACCAAFVERTELTYFIRAAVVHIVAYEVVSVTELYKRKRVGVHRRYHGSTVVRHLYAAAKLARCERIFFIRQVPAVRACLRNNVRTDCAVVSHTVKDKVLCRRYRLCVTCPRRGYIAAEYRNYLVHRNFRAGYAVPAGYGVEGCDKSAVYRNLFERCEVLGVVYELVFKLYGDYVSAVLVE